MKWLKKMMEVRTMATTIAAVDLIAKFKYAVDNNWGYIWGTAGDKWTQAK